MNRNLSRRLTFALTSAALLLTVAAPASAHVGIIDGDAVIGGGHGSVITLRVPHGCDGSPTDTVEVLIPEGVTGVLPSWIAGWTVETDPRPGPSASGAEADPEVGVVRWTGGPLPEGQFLDFRLLAVFPEAPGTLHFPVVQRCGDDEAAWIEIPAAGQSEEDLEHPAPSVTVIEGAPDDH